MCYKLVLRRRAESALRSLTAQCPPQLRLPGLPDVPIVETRWFMDLLSRGDKTRNQRHSLALAQKSAWLWVIKPAKVKREPQQ